MGGRGSADSLVVVLTAYLEGRPPRSCRCNMKMPSLHRVEGLRVLGDGPAPGVVRRGPWKSAFRGIGRPGWGGSALILSRLQHALQRLRGIQSGDILLDTTDGRTLRLRRVSRPDAEQQHLLDQLRLNLPERLGSDAECSADSASSRSSNQSLGPAHSRFMRKSG